MKKKKERKASQKKKEEKIIDRRYYYGTATLLVLVIILFLWVKPEQQTIPEQLVENQEESLASLFSCEGKNPYLSECWKKIQVPNRQIIYQATPGKEFVWEFAFMNKETTAQTFTYHIYSLPSADLVKEGCPLPAKADDYIIEGKTGKDITLQPQEITKRTLKLQISTEIVPAGGCNYRFVLEVKKGEAFYEKTYFDLNIS